jgi:hypothetical protein
MEKPMIRKKVMRKERRSGIKDLWVKTYNVFQTPPIFPLTTIFFLPAKFRIRMSRTF